ncbi:Rrf2 family transcriptional regulator [Hydrogenophaga sp. YM1]|uniref:RrF2 family transcriptional regulator n=1 Tax=Hydrogenophaga TaxID=47420 RepID=UPI00087866AF|nr:MULTISPECIES: Rrf2 family transcriptional regulator [unclassified Hydrogenophaga]QRR34120.1 Rrf2 family transcriptional regulator [Hydrogenophaga sp. YM1]
MRLTTLTDYALRLLMYVARQPGRLCTIAEVAQAHGISEAHLMKVTHLLGRQGWIETVRGKGGGMRLARAPADINLGAVVRGMEPDFLLVECFGEDSRCALTGRCGLAGVLDGALQSFLSHLDGHTLADLLPPAAAVLRRA